MVSAPATVDREGTMRTVEASRFVRATLPEVERHLDPATIIDYEGTFSVVDVREADGGWVVTGRGGGLMEVEFEVEAREDGYVYRQAGDAGPFEEMETTLELARKDEGVTVTMQSSVSLGVPLPLADRVAAWKRRGELKRALRRLAAAVE